MLAVADSGTGFGFWSGFDFFVEALAVVDAGASTLRGFSAAACEEAEAVAPPLKSSAGFGFCSGLGFSVEAL